MVPLYEDEQNMKPRKGRAKKDKSTLRASVSFPPDLYKTLENIARKKKVSPAWLVRNAAEKYAGDEWPLFRGQNQQNDSL